MVGLSNLAEGRSLTDTLINGFGAMNTFQASFADVNVKRSFFHLLIWNNVQNIGFSLRCVEEPGSPLQLQMLTTLPFILPQDVVWEFEVACNEIKRNFGDVAEELLVQFEDTCIGKFCINSPKSNIMLSIEFWKHAPSH